MNIEEAKKMLGTEFTYMYPDGDTISAYVKMFDEKIGLTCWTLEAETRDGWKNLDRNTHNMEPDGTYCIIGINLKYAKINPNHSITGALDILQVIKDTGMWHKKVETGGGGASCAFM